MPAERREQAIDDCTAPEIFLPSGKWSRGTTTMALDSIGYLVLEGLMLRRVAIDGRYAVELLGECDVLRPWFDAMTGLRLPRGPSFDLDFHTIPLHGNDALVEKHYYTVNLRLIGSTRSVT